MSSVAVCSVMGHVSRLPSTRRHGRIGAQREKRRGRTVARTTSSLDVSRTNPEQKATTYETTPGGKSVTPQPSRRRSLYIDHQAMTIRISDPFHP